MTFPKKPQVPLGATPKVDRVDVRRDPNAPADPPPGPDIPQTAAARPNTLSDIDAPGRSVIAGHDDEASDEDAEPVDRPAPRPLE